MVGVRALRENRDRALSLDVDGWQQRRRRMGLVQASLWLLAITALITAGVALNLTTLACGALPLVC